MGGLEQSDQKLIVGLMARGEESKSNSLYVGMGNEEEETTDAIGDAIPTMKRSAVLEAIRAMQDKIRRLEDARDEAVEEALHAQSQLQEQQEKSDPGEASLRQAYARLVEERADLEHRLASAERNASDAEKRYRDCESRRIIEAQRATDSERRLRVAERSVEESLVKSARLAARAEAWSSERDEASATVADLETVLEATVAVNKQLVADLRAATNGNVAAPDTEASDLLTDARAALSDAKVALASPRVATRWHFDVKKALDAPRVAPRSLYSRKVSQKLPTTTKRRNRRKSTAKRQPTPPPKVIQRKFKPVIPWVPSSTIGGVSYNVRATRNFALRQRKVRNRSTRPLQTHCLLCRASRPRSARRRTKRSADSAGCYSYPGCGEPLLGFRAGNSKCSMAIRPARSGAVPALVSRDLYPKFTVPRPSNLNSRD